MTTAKQRYRREIEEAISNAKDTGAREIVNAADGAEIYAYYRLGRERLDGLEYPARHPAP